MKFLNNKLNTGAGFSPTTFNNYKSGEGFTIIELAVGMTVFVLIISAISGILISSIKLQRKSLAEQEMLNQLSFAIEYMSRALRMAVKESGSGCLPANTNYDNPSGESSIKFINHLLGDECQEFFLDLENKTLKYKRGAITLDLTSPKLEVEELRFRLSGQLGGDGLQPRITICLKAKSEGFAYPIQLQTTISQRNLDI